MPWFIYIIETFKYLSYLNVLYGNNNYKRKGRGKQRV